MKIVFLDANVLFAATLSETGGSRALFVLAKKKKIGLTSSVYAITEAKRNILKKFGKERLPIFFQLLSELKEIHDPIGKILNKSVRMEEKSKKIEKVQLEENDGTKEWVNLTQKKDLPILWGASQLEVDVLATLDRRDFMNEKMKAQEFSFKIMTPGELIQSL